METAAQLREAGGAALAGRRINRYFLNPTGNKGRFYAGTVTGPAKSGKKGMLVHILYDNTDEEELGASDLAECLLPEGAATPLKDAATPGRPKGSAGASGSGGGATPRAQKRKATEDVGALLGPLRSPAAAPMSPPRSPAASPKAGGATPTRLYHGITLKHGAWAAQLSTNGKMLCKSGFQTQEEAALAWNELARSVGRTDFNVVNGQTSPAPGSPRAAPRADAPAPKRAKARKQPAALRARPIARARASAFAQRSRGRFAVHAGCARQAGAGVWRLVVCAAVSRGGRALPVPCRAARARSLRARSGRGRVPRGRAVAPRACPAKHPA